ncbi:MAG: LOG family protein [Chloroflexi bacterium]|nr:LOG family protein [Chloroflexota bacterium]
MTTKIISVFGGSVPKVGTAAYTEAMLMGKRLAESGYAVATGGYSGVMEAASRGAAEASGHVIGVTCGLLEDWLEGTKANQWVKEEIKFGTLSERLYHLVKFCDAAIALGGGIGTLSEISLLWSLIQTREIKPKPMIVVGPLWRDTLSGFIQSADGYIRHDDKNIIQYALDVEDAVKMLIADGV